MASLLTTIQGLHSGSLPVHSVAPQTPEAHLPSTTLPAQSEMLTTIPKDLDKAILTKTRSFRDAVFKLAKARKHLAKLAKESASFEESGFKYPRKFRELKSPIAFAELDNPFSQSSAGDFQHIVTIPVGTSRRDAMRIVHHQCSSFIATAYEGAQREHVTALETLSNPEVLQGLVHEVLAEASKPDLAETFGLPKPITARICPSAVSKRVDELYASIYSKLDAKLRADEAAASKSASATLAADADILKATPGQLLDQLVESKVALHLQSAGLASQDEQMDASGQPDTTADQFVQAIHPSPKNSGSPPVAVGQNLMEARPKAVAKPGGRHSKGKGKGKGKGNGKDRKSHHQGRGRGNGSSASGRHGGQTGWW